MRQSFCCWRAAAGGNGQPAVASAGADPLDRRVEEYERQIITEALNIHQGRINEVAEYLQIPRKNFICA